jgi:hypothetical protein
MQTARRDRAHEQAPLGQMIFFGHSRSAVARSLVMNVAATAAVNLP